jgi:hypothetical protein
MPDVAKLFDGKKFMWDSKEYGSESEAKETAEEYKKEKFETQVVEEEGKWFVYSRRVVTEIVVEGAPQ